jgi:hypothetical protein
VGLLRKAVRRSVPRSVRRATHPGRTVRRAATPRSIKRISRAAWNVSHPLGAAENALLDAAFSSGYRRRAAGPGQRSAPDTAPDPDGFDEVRRWEEIQEALTSEHRAAFPAAKLGQARVEDFLDKLPPYDPVARRGEIRQERRRGLHFWQRRLLANADRIADQDAEADLAARRALEARTLEEAHSRAAAAQIDLDDQWQLLLAGKEDAVVRAVSAALGDGLMPAFAIACRGKALEISLMFADSDSLPERVPDLTPTGRPTLRQWSKTERNAFYLDVLGSNVLATVRAAFAAAPSIVSVAVAVLRAADPDGPEPIYWGTFERSTVESIDWGEADTVELLQEPEDWQLLTKGRADEVVACWELDDEWEDYIADLGDSVHKVKPPTF